MLCLPAKTTSNKVDWASSLSKYVARAYSKAQAEALQSVVARLTVSGKARQPARRGGTEFALAAVGDYTPLSARGFSAKA